MTINRNILKSYAPQARREFIQAVTDRASVLGLSAKKIEPVEVKGDVAIIAGRPFPKDVAERRKKLEERIKIKGFHQVMETVAYTWFNRFCALRYMELHDYLGHGYRVLSNPSGSDIPEILEKATSVDLPGLDKDKVAELRLAGDKDSELYRLLLVTQCNALHRAMPMMFEAVHGASELLLPENLLQTNSPIRKLVNDIPEENWSEIEIVGWLYQFYISEKKDQVIGKVVKSEDIPAATQLFTPNWIVKYMVQNTVGRKWLMTYPASSIKDKMEFYIEPAEQEDDVQAKLDVITPNELNPEELTFMDPACGSGHILAEAYDLFKEIYLERGYRTRDIPRLILEKNLYGLDIDDRAAQLARFTVLMKARADDRRILDPENPAKLNVIAIQESKGLDVDEAARILLRERVKEIGGKAAQQLSLVQPKVAQASLSTSDKPDVTKEELYSLLYLFENGKTFGSLLKVHDRLKNALPRLEKLLAKALTSSDLQSREYAEALLPLVTQTKLLAAQYDYVVANPPYMGKLTEALIEYAKHEFPNSKSDLCTMFIERCMEYTLFSGHFSLVTMQSWMFLKSYQKLRMLMIDNYTLDTLIHLGPHAFDSITGEVVQTVTFSFRKIDTENYTSKCVRIVNGSSESEKIHMLRSTDRDSYQQKTSRFSMIPGSPFAYWVSSKIFDLFSWGVLKDSAEVRQGMLTTNNDKYLRLWHEVDEESIERNARSKPEAAQSQKKWFPYNKGTKFQKWFGDLDYIVDWEGDGERIKNDVVTKYPYLKGNTGLVIKNTNPYFTPAVTWSDISSKPFGARYIPHGFLYDKGGSCVHHGDPFYIMGYINTHFVNYILGFINPTFHFQSGDVSRIPFSEEIKVDKGFISSNSKRLVEIYKHLESLEETSYLFTQSPLLAHSTESPTIDDAKNNIEQYLSKLDNEVSFLEKGINDVFQEALDINSEDCCHYERQTSPLCEKAYGATSKLISYAIGCMMGRYSLDEPGLIYAHSGNEDFDPSRYATFPADEDGIVPVMDDDWFEDDATNRFEEFLKVAWSPETLDENLKFVADSLDPKRGEASIDTIRRFISQKFFKDHHLKVYKKRPIYWLFSSGKQRAFECLVYLHRYNENTLARMRAMYVTPLQGKYNARIDYLDKEKDNAGSATAARKLQKELDTMRKKQQELREFDELLRHYADQRIPLDLDDGVKVNYGKFGKLLAEVKAVTGKKPE